MPFTGAGTLWHLGAMNLFEVAFNRAPPPFHPILAFCSGGCHPMYHHLPFQVQRNLAGVCELVSRLHNIVLLLLIVAHIPPDHLNMLRLAIAFGHSLAYGLARQLVWGKHQSTDRSFNLRVWSTTPTRVYQPYTQQSLIYRLAAMLADSCVNCCSRPTSGHVVTCGTSSQPQDAS